MSSHNLVAIAPACHCRTWSAFQVPRAALPLHANACHCKTACRQQTGALAAHFAHLPPGTDNPLTDQERDLLTGYQLNEGTTRYFCARCGAKILSEERETGQTRLYIFLGAIPPTLSSGEATYSLNHHIFVQPEDGGGLLRYSTDTVPRFINNPDDSGSADPSSWTLTPSSSSTTTLPLKCRCGRFAAHLLRPSACPDQSEWIQTIVSSNKWRWTLCFCTSCRLTSGNPHSAFAFIAHDAVVLCDGLTPRTTGSLTHYESSPGVVRSFCPACGANVFYDDRTEDSKGALDVFMGVVDAPLGEVLEEWVYRKESIRQYSEDAIHHDIADPLLEGWEKSTFA